MRRPSINNTTLSDPVLSRVASPRFLPSYVVYVAYSAILPVTEIDVAPPPPDSNEEVRRVGDVV